MKYRVLLIGAGQIGSRYLQGMAGVQYQLEILVIDTLASSLVLTEERWYEAGGASSNHTVKWLREIPYDLREVDIVIIATGAKGRGELIKRISDSLLVRYWIVEKVLAQSSDELNLILESIKGSAGAWINLARRMMVWHEQIKNSLQGHSPLTVTYSGMNWGLACNTIHLIDLVAWWTGERLDKIITDNLDGIWQESKRPGYFEITGSLLVCYSGGSILKVTASRDQMETQFLVASKTGANWSINEKIGNMTGDEFVISGRLELQSELTEQIISLLLTEGSCRLPRIEEGAHTHSMFIEAMRAHWNFSMGKNDLSVPIT